MDEFELLNHVFPQIHRLESTLYTSRGFLEGKTPPKIITKTTTGELSAFWDDPEVILG
jgi:hypothetical protein